MLDSLKEWVGTEEFIQVFYNSWVNLKTQFAKRKCLKYHLENKNMTLKSPGFKQT